MMDFSTNHFKLLSGYRILVSLIGLLIIVSCSSTKFVDSWKNKEITTFKPEKILVVGMTNNLTGRTIFEEELSKSFIQHGINAYESINVIDASFSHSKKDEKEINEMVVKLAEDGFDAIAVTAVKGVENMEVYSPDYYTVNYNWYRFGRYYYKFQDIYYTPQYYNQYKVYHIETSIYNIMENDAKSLVWVGSFDIVDPQSMTPTIKDYVTAIMKQLERENLIDKLK